MLRNQNLFPRTFAEYKQLYADSIKDQQQFWADAAESFSWRQKWQTVLSGGFQNVD